MDRIDQLGEEIGTLQNMRSSFNPILNTIVGSLNASIIFMRTKALRALGQIVTSDPTVLALVCSLPPFFDVVIDSAFSLLFSPSLS